MKKREYRHPSDVIAEREQDILGRRFEGQKLADIGKEWGLSHERVRQILEGIDAIPPKKVVNNLRTKSDWRVLNKLRKLYNIKDHEVAKEVGCGVTTVYQILSGNSAYVDTNHDYRGGKYSDGIPFRIYFFIISEVDRKVKEQESLITQMFLTLED